MFKRDVEGIADAERCSHRDWTAGLDLLPVTGREAKRNHIFLTVVIFYSKSSNSPPQCAKKFRLIYHAGVCKVSQAKTPRAD
jgi:hypothetical protein